MAKQKVVTYNFLPYKEEELIAKYPKEFFRKQLEMMLTIRHFEIRAESAYQAGKIGGFFHAYIGQEPIQTAAVATLGIKENWWVTTYRCHALALLMEESERSLMAELYGKASGNAKGRGGSMHLYSDRMLGGFGIVGGHLPIAAGAAFTLKYKQKEGVAVCFLGDGAVAQGTFHETLNLLSLWDLPCIVVIENNQWGMGTAVDRAVCTRPMAEKFAPAYGMSGYSLDGNDFFSCLHGFSHIGAEAKTTKRPILVECVTERFRGHSISDPGLYRSKEDLKKIMEHDPILRYKARLIANKIISEEEYTAIEERIRKQMIAAMEYADSEPLPDVAVLEDDVFAPN